MAYQVLARKYRPQRFADVAGQQHVTVTLMNALTQGRIAHGYIFSGHRGIGKTTIARILAMALNCRNAIGSGVRPTAEPCEVCESCTEIRAGNAVDVIEIDAATNRGIDEIRELRDAARYRPARDKYKIYILDEAHQITDAAFNALLKTLEEPPDHVVFMMATTQPEDIPQTVRSRCQHFNFHAVKMVDILAELRGIAAHEGVEADEGALALLAEAGDGSMRDALSVMDQAIASAPVLEGQNGATGRPALSSAQIRELMGTVSNAIFERLFEAVDGGRSAEVMTLANELMDAGNSPAQLARQCLRYLRNVLMAKISGVSIDAGSGGTGDGAAAELLQISPDEQRRAARTAGRFSEEELTRFLQVMLRTFDELGYRQEQRFHFELGLLKLVHLRRLLPVEELLSALPAAGTGGGTGARPAGTAAPLKQALPAKGSALLSAPEPSAVKPVESRPAFSPFAADTQRKRFDEPEAKASFGVKLAAAAAPGVGERVAPTSVAMAIGEITAAASAAAEREADAASPDKARPVQGGIPLPGDWTSPAAAPAAASGSDPGVRRAGDSVRRDGITAPLADNAQAAAADVVQRAEPSHVAPAQGGAETLQRAAIDALLRSGKQASAGEALEDAEWTLEAGLLRVQTGFSKAMLAMVVNPEADQMVRAAVRAASGEPLKIEFLPGAPREKRPTAKRAARSGSAQAKAEEHPIVRQAQQLFDAEIRNVIDLSGSK